jgi:citrate synthase
MSDPTAIPRFPTSLGVSYGSTMQLLGHDVTEELMGNVSFGELSLWLLLAKRPSPGQTKLFEAVLIGLADHGFTPTAIAARLTYLSAPDAIQGALAAGILGGGSRFLGVTEDTGRFIHEALAEVEALPTDDQGWDALALSAVRQRSEAHRLVPGLGHPVHKELDPRTPRIIEIAHEVDLYGPYLAFFEAVGRVHPLVLNRTLPLNGAGVSGAALADIGIPLELLRGTVLLARCAGLLGHIAEEVRNPIANSIYMTVDRNAEYVEPPE